MASSSSQTHNDTAPGLRARKQQQTRSDLIEAAAKLFADQGHHATTLDLIAKAAGYTKGAVYSNFTTKDDLFLAVLEQEIASRVAILGDIIGTNQPRQDWVKGIVTWFEATLDAERGWFLAEMEFGIHAVRTEEGRQQLESMYSPMLDAIARTTKTTVPPQLAGEMARLFWALSAGVALEHARAPDKTPLKALELALRRMATPQK